MKRNDKERGENIWEDKNFGKGRELQRMDQSPLRFLLNLGLIGKLAEEHPLVKTNRQGDFSRIAKVKLEDLFVTTVDYDAWMRQSAPVLGRYIDLEVAEMWKAFNEGNLTKEYPLDNIVAANGMSQRVVDGKEYRIAQLSGVLDLGYGWRVADWMTVPTGRVDASQITHPGYVRGLSPIMFYHPQMGRGGWNLRRDLTDEFARILFDLKRNTTYQVDGTASVSHGVYRPESIKFIDLVGGKKGAPIQTLANWREYEYGHQFGSIGGIVTELLKKAKKDFVPRVNKVAGLAKRVADDFWQDYAKNDKRFNPDKLELFSQLITSSWPGASLQYFERYYNGPANDFFSGKSRRRFDETGSIERFDNASD
ncbi:hypothetical protein KJ707_04465 [Patescibacteria group bacterium]|nr:hypothetical protein [Patescibacteria group bacterium]MBU1966694.1 hypothetical protein [Patescibacteria group bacterium]MBU2543786.1 hypothetical protein [Patescibacteria group bacterium]